jgi:hypothetical protein
MSLLLSMKFEPKASCLTRVCPQYGSEMFATGRYGAYLWRHGGQEANEESPRAVAYTRHHVQLTLQI